MRFQHKKRLTKILQKDQTFKIHDNETNNIFFSSFKRELPHCSQNNVGNFANNSMRVC